MNKIFKVIYSKVRHCYVVTSEFAKANTKSSTGSERNRTGRKALLTLAIAAGIFCGGLGVAEASVHVNEVADGTSEVYTTSETYTKAEADAKYATATNVTANTTNIATNKENITALQTTATEQGKLIATNTANIANNTTAIEKKIDTETANERFATKDALGDLQNQVTNKVDKNIFDEALYDKADKTTVTALDGRVGDVEGKVTTLETTVGDASSGLVKDVADLKAQGTTLNTELGNKANKTDLYAANAKITVLQNKTANLYNDGKVLTGMTTVSGTTVSGTIVEAGALKVTGEISNGDGVNTTLAAINNSMTQTATNKVDIATNKADIATNTTAINELNTKTINQQTAIDGLNAKTTKITYDAALGTSVDGVTFNAGAVTGVTSINGTVIGTKESGTYIHQDSSIWGNMKQVDTQVKTNADNIVVNKNAITVLNTKVGTVGTGTYLDPTKSVGKNLGLLDAGLKSEVGDRTAAVEAEKTAREAEDTALSNRIGTVDADGKYIKKSDTNNVSENLKVLDTQAKTNADAIAQETADRKEAIGELAVNGQYIEKDKNVSDNLVKLDNQAKANADEIAETNERTNGIVRNTEKTQTTIEGKVTVDNSGNVGGVKNLSAETIKTTGNATIGGALNVTGKSDFKEAVKMDKGLTVTNGDTTLKDTKVDGDLKVTGTITTDKMIFGDKATNNYTEIDKGHITSKNNVLAGDATKKSSSMELDHSKLEVGVADKDSNSHLTMDADKTQLTNSDLAGKNYSDIVADKDKIKTTVKDENGNTSSVKESASEINHWVQDKDGNWSTNHQDATSATTTVSNKDGSQSTQVEQTSTDITNTAKDGTIKNDAKNIVNSATGNISNSSAIMDTTVTGEATESYGKLTTTVEGDESHTVKGNQINTINGTQSTTVKGNVSEDYKQDLTTNIGGNELHEVTGAKTETVTGKVTENFKGGQETNVTGDQTTTISDTQTTTAKDIKRNASSSMMDIVDNEYGTNTETKVAGKTTTEVTIKETGENGEYIRGANEAKDTLTKGTLKNSETKTVKATSTEITDGSGNTSFTIQDKANLAGSVTNGTETGVSGIHAKDGIVSIDSAVTDGKTTSTINQKKDSITSAVGEGGNSTVIRQDKDNVTIASSNGTVAIVGKDIINNATGNMTNTVGGNEKHTVKGNQTNEVDGDQTNTIKGNQTTTVTGDISNSAKNITNEASEKLMDKVGTNTRVLDNDGITDTVGNTSFKQRIDDIMMEAKNGTITSDAKNLVNKAAETITNEAVDITNNATGTISSNASEIKNKADKLISNKVGENTYQNIEDGKITESIKNGTKQNLTQSDADGTNHSVVNGNKSSVTKQTSEEITGAVTDGTSTNVTQNTATSSNNTIASNGKANSVISTVNGTEFVNSDAAAPVTGASGAGTADRTTIKGNTITTGNVTMDYADVMKDLGVKGNANIAGKTTTGSLEVTNESTFNGKATFNNGLEVTNGDTKLKNTEVDGTLNVTQNTTIGGTLDVTGKATFKDDVEVAKDLSVGGNATITGDVTANSYKVGNNTYIDANGINANNQKVTNVADGTIAEGSKDAVNGGQLFETNRRIDQFDSRINEVGANAAAMANLHPMEFDADSKLNVAVGVGNYRNKTATAMGLFYRPNEDVMFNVSSTIGSSDNMIGGGVSFRLGSGGNKLKNKAFADAAEQNKQLKSQVDTLQAQMDALLSVINPNMSKDFPDVPDNHWAYEAVSRLAGNDIIQGYEDGKYHGERTMTRYEMAVIIYKALQKGAKAEAKLVEEFKPELKAIAAHEKA